MKEIQATEYVSAKEICKTLKIQVPTLRKYARLLDEKAKSEFYFDRDEQNNRIFTKENIVVLKRIIELKNKPNYTLNAAITQVVELEDNRNTIDVTTEKTALQSLVFQQVNYLKEYQSALLKKDEQLDRKDEQINRKDEQIERLESLVNSLVENDVSKKKKWFNFKK